VKFFSATITAYTKVLQVMALNDSEVDVLVQKYQVMLFSTIKRNVFGILLWVSRTKEHTYS
jgi:hypothetical protein